jgi:Tol biopolymer transport system component
VVPARAAAGHQHVVGEFSRVDGELFRINLETGANEHLLPGFPIRNCALSPDGKRVVFSAVDPQRRVRLWIADLDLRSSPRQFASLVDEDQPNFDQNGNIYFRAVEGGSNFLYRMKADGSDRVKALPNSIIGFMVSRRTDAGWSFSRRHRKVGHLLKQLQFRLAEQLQ